MITKDAVITKFQDRLARKCSAMELNHWAKGLMFDTFENRKTYDPDHRDLLERSVLRAANSSTNYRTFLFNSEIVKLLTELGVENAANGLPLETYSVSVIMGQQESVRSQDTLNKIKEHFPPQKNFNHRIQGSGLVMTAEQMNEEELHMLAQMLQNISFIMSLKDFEQTTS